MREEILELLVRKISELTGRNEEELGETTDVKHDVRLTSMELVAIIGEFENEYDVYIKYTDLLHAVSIGEMADMIDQTISE